MILRSTQNHVTWLDKNKTIIERFQRVKEIIEYDDLLFNPGWYAPEEITIYKNEQMNPSLLDTFFEDTIYHTDLWAAKNEVLRSRTVYNLLDLFGDIGGL